MTRTTLKALWVGGGGIVATWLAVSPNPGVPTAKPESEVRRPASAGEPTAEELNAQARRLRDRTDAVTLRSSTRNPFRYGSSKPAPRSIPQPDRTVEPAAVVASVPAAPSLELKLSGVAQRAGTRTAVISGEGQIYLVGEGDSVAGRYIVVTIDPEAVLLRDASGAEQRLFLPQ